MDTSKKTGINFAELAKKKAALGNKPNFAGFKVPTKKTNLPGDAPKVEKPEIKQEVKQEVKPEVKQEAVNTPSLKFNNPFLKKNTQPEPKAESMLDKMKSVAENKVEKKEETKSIIADLKEEKAVTETSIPTPVEEIKEEVKEQIKEQIKEEPKEEVKKEKPAPRKRKTAKKEEAVVVEKPQENIECETVVDMPVSTVTYGDAIRSTRTSFIDMEWEKIVMETTEAIDEIVISSDMNSIGIKVTIAKLNDLRQSIWRIHNDTKTTYETLVAKEPAGLIERIKIAGAVGANAEERKQSGLRSVMNYKKDGQIINLLEVLDETRERYNYLKSLMESIQYKTNVLITMLGALKQEK